MRLKRLNPIQVAASAAGAVLSAVIASFFGVEGTIIGTAIGSIVATSASALVWESIERGHEAVRQVVVKDHTPFLRSGTTGSAGEVTSAGAEASAVDVRVDAGMDAQVAAGQPAAPGRPGSPDEPPGPASRPVETAAAGGAATGTGAGAGAATGAAGAGAVARAGAGAGAAAGSVSASLRHSGAITGQRRLLASSRGGRPLPVHRTAASPERRSGATIPERRSAAATRSLRRITLVVLSIVGVFALALGVITAVEVIAGRPISSLLGRSGTRGGTTAVNAFTGTKPAPSRTPAPPATTPTTAPPVTTPSTSTTSTSSTTTTTTTTAGAASSTTTTTTTSTTAPRSVRGTGAGGSAG